MKKLYLHIGTEKTGTTSLQYFLAENRERLAAQGCWLSGCVMWLNHFLLAVCCYDEFRNDDLCRHLAIGSANQWELMKQQIMAQLTQEIDSSACNYGIVTSENFQSRLFTESEKGRLKDMFEKLGFDDVTVILYIRDPASLANSRYFTDVAQGHLGRLPGKPDEHYFKNLCDHRTTIQQWQSVYGKDRLIIRLYDADGRGKFSTIDDFLGLIPEINSQKLKPVKNGNVSISALGVELIRRINEIEPFWVNGTVNPVRKGLNHRIRKHYRGASYGMPEWLAQEYDMAFADSNEWVRQNFFPDRDTLFVRKKIRESVLEMSESDLQRETMKLVGMLRRRHHRKLWRREVISRLRSHLEKFLKRIGGLES